MSVNQKLENLLNLSLDTTAKERSRSAELETRAITRKNKPGS